MELKCSLPPVYMVGYSQSLTVECSQWKSNQLVSLDVQHESSPRLASAVQLLKKVLK